MLGHSYSRSSSPVGWLFGAIFFLAVFSQLVELVVATVAPLIPFVLLAGAGWLGFLVWRRNRGMW